MKNQDNINTTNNQNPNQVNENFRKTQQDDKTINHQPSGTTPSTHSSRKVEEQRTTTKGAHQDWAQQQPGRSGNVDQLQEQEEGEAQEERSDRTMTHR